MCLCAHGRVCVCVNCKCPSGAVADGKQGGTVSEHRISSAEHLYTAFPHFTCDFMATCCFCRCSYGFSALILLVCFQRIGETIEL